jgi:lipoyl(octanoyl) transferase
MDLSPFQRINPCGYAGLEMIDCASIGGPKTLTVAGPAIVEHFCQLLGIELKEYKEGFDE